MQAMGTQTIIYIGSKADPSTQGSGRKLLRLIPITLMIVLIAAIPSHPELRATLAGYIKEDDRYVRNVIKYGNKHLR